VTPLHWGRLVEAASSPGSQHRASKPRLVDNETVLYDDGKIVCDDRSLVIRTYYLWGAAKTIPYSAIRSVTKRPLTGVTGKWRIWGSGDFVHWWNLDTKRPSKNTALMIDLGKRVVPTITPDDPDAVERILSEHIG